MKLRDRVSLMFAMANRAKVQAMMRRKSGKKVGTPQFFEGQNTNHGPAISGKSKNFKRNKRMIAQRVAYRKSVKNDKVSKKQYNWNSIWATKTSVSANIVNT